ncbi:permease [Kroppenstedtia eburnea]|nr:permease [Kroppenstedtia eburnea]
MWQRKKWIGFAVFLLIAAVGLYLVKWAPYYEKAIKAMAEHSIGPSIISGESATVPAPSWNAALSYSIDYFQAIWQAMIVGIVLGSLIQVLVPKDWLVRWLGRGTFKSTMVGGLCGMPSMMCTCCAAPVVVGMRKSQSSIGAAIAYWMSNTALNPAVLVFMAFILSWKFVLLRVLLGLVLVFGVSHLLNRLAPEKGVEMEKIIPPSREQTLPQTPFIHRWWKQLKGLTLAIVPAYIITVFILGGVRAWLFPAIDPDWGNSPLAIIGFALAGMLFVIPTAGEIPIAQTLMAAGLGAGPAAALIFTLPVISLPSAIMVSRALPWRVIAALAGMILLLGILGGFVATAWF